ncbi:iron complex transport system ATP-binding protein [Raineyella antarctica]|uniref:Iron complex transport system ATP-binding protein n=1 Tax=Raineyella antarctica TaxID=1577474 RepID=A0A1G6H9V2_9ACTN|nr:ABC transporter ATP-binding protein [Raineyella antarctica]SDB90991.1 iron complex transport system ATP-binding protein [Raineyella antarctica]
MVAVVDLVDVSVRRGSTMLLDGINWQVGESDRWVVLGANGAGKTTLLRLLTGDLYPTTGMAGVLDEVLGAVNIFDLRPRIGLVSQTFQERVPRGETVHDLVVSAAYAVVGRWREEYEGFDHERADALLERFGMLELRDRTFGTLSSGERKRVEIARALMVDPELLLLDEPASGLDLGGRENLVRLLGHLAADAAAPASVMVTHHVEEIPPGITHALLLKKGRIVASGPAREVLTEPLMSETFDMPLRLVMSQGRFTARAR